ncbi:MAG: ABC transporter ATP-binding protein [Oscillospiraceae bacterium]
MIKIEKLYKSYKYHQVLKGLDMHVRQGEVYGFIGENGAGKSTTMNIICNVIPKQSGIITINGDKPAKIGYLPENPTLFNYMTAGEYLDYIAACCKYDGDIGKRNAELLELVNLTGAKDRKIKGYSRGMNQRLGLASIMYNDPDVYILDEPTSALDPQGRAEVMEIIKKLKESGKTVLLSTHILTDVERIADRVGILVGGKLIEERPLTELIGTGEEKIVNFAPAVRSEENHKKIMEYGNMFLNDMGDYETRFNSNSEEQIISLMRYLSDENIALARFFIKHPTLEEVYLKAVRSNAN